ncbi:TetR/AcrR family transcriptional regulator [Methylobacterium sp.]|uniref:TetR/AcrR family transcriptional regulator n=1 Tax=Methylobacterium sp. TaxID=409 RepID=UPI003C712B14
MRVSRAQADANRDRVIDVASRLFRKHGFDGIGLADLMKGAGLTQGGFYKQFASKEDLAAQACARAVTAVQERWRHFAARDPERPLASLVRSYLSVGHRDATEEGCVLAALGADAARTGCPVRASLEKGVEAYVDFLESLLPQDGANRRQRAMALASTMVGAIVLSRAVNDETLSETILNAAAQDILEREGTASKS